jgi:hypothetical protein
MSIENIKNNLNGFLDDIETFLEYQNNLETELFGALNGTNTDLTKAYKRTIKRKLLATKIIHNLTKLNSIIENPEF